MQKQQQVQVQKPIQGSFATLRMTGCSGLGLDRVHGVVAVEGFGEGLVD